ncbi:hypothetical protein J6590_060451 [Homalodisca vitripennis]|nr:hypothetical protein J6590_060451 [Homalodisca vitripennis]
MFSMEHNNSTMMTLLEREREATSCDDALTYTRDRCRPGRRRDLVGSSSLSYGSSRGQPLPSLPS